MAEAYRWFVRFLKSRNTENPLLCRKQVCENQLHPEFHLIGALDRETSGDLLLLFRGLLWGRRSERSRRLSGYPDFFQFRRLSRPSFLTAGQYNCRDWDNVPDSPHFTQLFTHRDLLYKSPAVSLVTERLVKRVSVFSGKPCVQGDASDASLSKVFLHSCNQRATNSAAASLGERHKSKNSPTRIVMLIA